MRFANIINVIPKPKSHQLILVNKEGFNVVIESKKAVKVWLKHGPKNPSCFIDPGPPTFRITFLNGEEYTWTAKVKKHERTDDLLMYDLKLASHKKLSLH